MATSDSSSPPENRSLAPSPYVDSHNIAPEAPLKHLQPQDSSESGPSNPEAKQATKKAERGRSDSGRTKSSLASRTSRRSVGRVSYSHGEVRTLPPWIDSVEATYDAEEDSKPSDGLLERPSTALPPQHHYAATKLDRRMSKDGYIDADADVSETVKVVPERGLFGTTREPVRGRKWDHARQGDPVIMHSHGGGGSSPWSTFARSSRYGPPIGEEGETVDPGFLNEQTPGYARPWRGDARGEDPEKALGLLHRKRKRLVWYQRAERSILMHPLVPLAFRLTVLATSTVALGLSSSIFHLTKSSPFDQPTSATMAIIVDVIAIPYICYITWDEYTGKPLGLRPPKAKMRLVLLDLFFIIFESANLALAFQTIADPDSACVQGPTAHTLFIDANLCGQAKALAAILFIALVAWSLTFTVSIIRLVQRVGGGDEND